MENSILKERKSKLNKQEGPETRGGGGGWGRKNTEAFFFPFFFLVFDQLFFCFFLAQVRREALLKKCFQFPYSHTINGVQSRISPLGNGSGPQTIMKQPHCRMIVSPFCPFCPSSSLAFIALNDSFLPSFF